VQIADVGMNLHYQFSFQNHLKTEHTMGRGMLWTQIDDKLAFPQVGLCAKGRFRPLQISRKVLVLNGSGQLPGFLKRGTINSDQI
jgi:hypothetical protein